MQQERAEWAETTILASLGSGRYNGAILLCKGGTRHAHCRSAHPFPVFQGHQQRGGYRPPGSLGPAQGHPPGGHRGFHPPRLASGAGGNAAAGGRGALYPAAHIGAARQPRGRSAPLCHHRRDQQHLQAGRQDPQGAQPDLAAQFRGGRGPFPQVGGHRQHPFRRAAHPGAGQPGPAGDHAGDLPRGRVHSRPHLDAPFCPVRRFFRL